MPGTEEGAARTVPRASRWFVRAFLGAFFVCAIFRLEAWPLTGFRIFSTPRHEIQRSWVVDTVGPNGTASTLWFDDLPRGDQDLYLLMPGFPRLPAAKERSICEAWLSGARSIRPRAVTLRIYRVQRPLLPLPDGRPRPLLSRTIEYACS